jgi:hypothetical protein
MIRDLLRAAPVYVTRKTADGFIAHYSLSMGMSLLAMMLIWANIVGWSLYGLYELGKLVFA